jgi:hypothetical protein
MSRLAIPSTVVNTEYVLLIACYYSTSIRIDILASDLIITVGHLSSNTGAIFMLMCICFEVPTLPINSIHICFVKYISLTTYRLNNT